MEESKALALKTALKEIEKTYGKGAVMVMGENQKMNVETFDSGSLSLNMALGVGGLPRGRIIEVYGPESSGKTTIAELAAASIQKEGGTAAFIDVEHALDPNYAKELCLDIDSLLVSQPDTGEQALEIAESLIRSGAVDLVVIDSVAALVPTAEIEGDMGDQQVGLQARLMSKALRKITAAVSKSRCTCIFINQLREKVGVYYGPSEVTSGGKALKFYASVRLDVRKADVLKSGNKIIGHRIKVKIVKNKVAPPFRQAEFDLIYGKGIDTMGEILDIGTEFGIFRRAGAYYYYGEESMGQGREKALDYLTSHPQVVEKAKKEVLENSK